MLGNPDGTTVESLEEESPGRVTFRGKSVRCDCGALAFDWIHNDDGSFVLKCSSCEERLLKGDDVEVSESQLDRLDRLDERRSGR